MNDRNGTKKGLTTFEKISVVFLALSFGLNIYLGVFAKRQAEELQVAELQLAIEREKPNVSQGRFVFTGLSLKAFASVDWSKAIIEGAPHPQLVETELGRQIYDLIDGTEARRALESIDVEFLAFTNRGRRTAEELRVYAAHGDEGLVLGDLEPGTSKLLPVSLVVKQPYQELTEQRNLANYGFSFTLLDQVVVEERQIAENRATSWVPSVDSLRGVGKALVSEEEAHLFR